MTIKEMFEAIRKQSKYYDAYDDSFEWWDFDIDYNTLVTGIVPVDILDFDVLGRYII